MRSMTGAQNRQEITDFQVLLMKCYVAESELAAFLFEKATLTELPTDDTFKLKHLHDKVRHLIRQIQASDEDSQKFDPTATSQPCLGKGLKETRISQDRRLFWRLNSLGEEEDEDWDEEEDEDWEEDEWSGAEGSGQESF